MDLDQWLVVYLSIVTAATAKRSSFWSMVGWGLLAQSLLGAVACVLMLGLPSPFTGFARLGLGGLAGTGLLTALGWATILRRLQSGVVVSETLARGIEGHFAGGEFFRALHRYDAREKVCIPSSEWTCNDWLPSVAQKSLPLRILGGLGVPLLVVPFLAGWIALLIFLLT